MPKIGRHVVITATAYILTETDEEAVARVVSGLRRQRHVMLTTITPVSCTTTDLRPDDYVEEDALETPAATHPTPKAKRRRLCAIHKQNLQDPRPCTQHFIGCAIKRLRSEGDMT